MNHGMSDTNGSTPRPLMGAGISRHEFDPTLDRLVDTEEAARILGVRPNTLAKARVYGGPLACPFMKMGRAVRYSTRTLVEHIQANTADSTSEHWAAA